MQYFRRRELEQVDEILRELALKKRTVPPREKHIILARIDMWLDQRIRLMT
jgi:hypothetical protein